MKNNFYEKVYEITRHVPTGKVTTYGAIARYLGAPSAARMVGWALNAKKTNLFDVPAHRVVNRNGMLTGKKYFPGDNMVELLHGEGVKVFDNRIVNFEDLFWDPVQYLNLES